MPRQALVAVDSGIENMIVASSNDIAAGFTLALMPDFVPIDQMWEWSGANGFVAPRRFAAVNPANFVTDVLRQRHSRAGTPSTPPGTTLHEINPADQVVVPGYRMISPGVFAPNGDG